MLLWLDLETTGLDPSSGHILEVAAQLTDITGDPIANMCETVVRAGEGFSVSARVACMHGGRGGLLELAMESPAAIALDVAERALINYVLFNVPPGARVHLAGSSIHFDRSWIARFWPSLLAHLHHRQVDLSSILLALEACGMDLRGDARRPDHRARPDIVWSMMTYRRAVDLARAIGTR